MKFTASIPAVMAGAALVFGQGAAAWFSNSECKTFPGDSNWPDTWGWNLLNLTVRGNLIKTVPLGSPCHDPNYDAALCAELQSEWQQAEIHMDSSSSIMAPFFANQSCDPFQPQSRECTLGNYVSYAVAAQNKVHVIAAVLFARFHNLRLVVRNTGHDYLGRSTGAGALGIWTHHLKDINIINNYSDKFYTGAAMQVGAGVQGFEAMEAAHNAGLTVVTGECPTVGLAGGYTQGGGHSAVSTNFGLSADNVLSYDIITSYGLPLTVTRTNYPDLFFALSGGGGGNWAVVTSMTVKAHREEVTGSASLTFLSSTNSLDDFYAAIGVFHEELAAMVDAGSMVVYYFTTDFFAISPLTAFGKTEAEVRAILAPFVARLDDMGIVYTASYTGFASYYEHYDAAFGPLPIGNIGVGIAQYGGRLIPRSVAGNISETLRFVVEQGVTWIGVGTDVSSFGGDHNSVLPAWRDALIHTTLSTPWSFTAPWEDMIELQDLMTEVVMPAVEAVTPGSGVYLNEADFRQPNWKDAFFGVNYDRLLDIKRTWDPTGLFYAHNGIASDDWVISNDGRMCHA